MKQKTTISFFIIAMFIFSSAEAKIWRVNNKSNYNGSTLWGDNFGGTAAYPVFVQINQAVAFGAVVNGDTLHVEGSPANYAISVITKKLVIIGAGYFLTDNPKTSTNMLESDLQELDFDTNSDGSQVIGVNIVAIGNNGLSGAIYVNVNGITIKRCRIEKLIQFTTGLSNVTIVENFFSNSTVSNAFNPSSPGVYVPPTDIIFNNNICQKTLTWGTPIANPTTLWPILQCNNNVFDGPDNLATPSLAFSTSEFQNNILMPTNAKVNMVAAAGVIAYNVGTLSTQFGTADNNLVVPAIASLFVTSSSTDGAYQVASGSMANNNGSDGTDRGAFGGVATGSRYTLSGLAPIPVVYQVTTTSAASNSLQVTIQARTIK